MTLSRPAGGTQFRVHKHVELAANGGRAVSGQSLEIVNHVHLIVIAEVVGNISPLHLGRRRLASESSFEADDPSVQLG
jgi:hypothetical protein